MPKLSNNHCPETGPNPWREKLPQGANVRGPEDFGGWSRQRSGSVFVGAVGTRWQTGVYDGHATALASVLHVTSTSRFVRVIPAQGPC